MFLLQGEFFGKCFCSASTWSSLTFARTSGFFELWLAVYIRTGDGTPTHLYKRGCNKLFWIFGSRDPNLRISFGVGLGFELTNVANQKNWTIPGNFWELCMGRCLSLGSSATLHLERGDLSDFANGPMLQCDMSDFFWNCTTTPIFATKTCCTETVLFQSDSKIFINKKFQQFTFVRLVDVFYGFYRGKSLFFTSICHVFQQPCPSESKFRSWNLFQSNKNVKKERDIESIVWNVTNHPFNESFVASRYAHELLRISDGLWDSDDGVFGTVLISTIIFT